MAKASQVAAALRTVAENLEREPETDIGFYYLVQVCDYDKDRFLARARLMPRPAKKEYETETIRVSHDFMASEVRFDYALRCFTEIPRNIVCESKVIGTQVVPEYIIPAVEATPERIIPAFEAPILEWNCVPLLSGDEEDALLADREV